MPTPRLVDPVQAAWARCNPRTPFPAELAIPGRRVSEPDAEGVDPAAEAKRLQWNAYQRAYQRRRRAARTVARSG